MNELLENNPGYFAVLFLIFFGLMWFGVLSLLSLLSGWRTLAATYAHDGNFEGRTRHLQSMSMGYFDFFPVNHGGSAILGVNEKGVYFSVLFPFRPFHAPFFVPFEDLESKTLNRMIFKVVRLQVKNAPGVSIKISKRQANWFAKHSAGNWQIQLQTCEG